MNARHKNSDISHALISRVMILVVGAATVLFPVWTAFAQTNSEPTSNNEQASAPPIPTHMSEALRASIKKVAVIAIGIDLAGAGVIAAIAVFVAQTSLYLGAAHGFAFVFGERFTASARQTAGIDAGVIFTVFVGIAETLFNGCAA